MFDSGITAADLIAEIESEADIAPDIEKSSYIQWLNSVEQLLYSEIIKEQRKYKIDLFSPLLKVKLNFCPVFSGKIVNDVVLVVLGNGEYKLNPTKMINTTTTTGAVFTAEVTLPAGTYTLSDSSLRYQSNMLSGRNRVYVTNAATGAVIAGVDVNSTSGATFTLSTEQTVNVCLNVPQGADLTSSGRISKPQLEVGPKMTEFVPPYSKDEISYLLYDFPTSTDEDQVRFEDVYAVYADGTQLIKSTLTSGMVFSDTYFKEDGALGLHFSKTPGGVTVVYTVRPELKSKDNYADKNVRVPVEFIDLVKAKLRGEAYKLANEDSLAAKWLNDYNVLLETFREWVRSKDSVFGL